MRYIVFLIVLMFNPSAHAYSKYGHVAICELAYRELTDTTRAEVNRLLAVEMEREAFQHTSYNRSCLDADGFPRERPAAHFLNVSRDLDAITDHTCGGVDECVLSAIDTEFATLTNPSASDFDKSLSLRFIGHWIGDVHQPLHVSYKDDRGGNSIKKRGRCSARNLHAVWDNCIVERRVFDFGFFTRTLGFAKFTKVYRAVDRIEEEITNDEREAWAGSKPWEWAAESYDVSTTDAVGYCHKRNDACWYAVNNKVLDEDEEQRTIQMTDEYLDAFKPVVELRLKQAGVRLAHTLNLAFDPDYDPANIEGD